MIHNIAVDAIEFLPVRITAALRKAGIVDTNELADKTLEELLAIRIIGQRAIIKIQWELRKLGYAVEWYESSDLEALSTAAPGMWTVAA